MSKPESTLTPFERAVINKLDFLCAAAVVVQQRLLWCAGAAGLVAFVAVVLGWKWFLG